LPKREGDLLQREAPDTFFELGPKKTRHVVAGAVATGAIEIEVFLDDAVTKSEDCEAGAGTSVLSA
jgi:hypothetical protein